MYAFYGSLRKGMDLYKKFEFDLQYKFSLWLPGYDLYSLGPYPCAIKSKNSGSKILIEVMHITSPMAEQKIFDIERNAGYYFEEVTIGKQLVGMFLYEHSANYPKVLHGDWVTFFGEQRK